MDYERSCEKYYLTKFKDSDSPYGSEEDDEEVDVLDARRIRSTGEPPAKKHEAIQQSIFFFKLLDSFFRRP